MLGFPESLTDIYQTAGSDMGEEILHFRILQMFQCSEARQMNEQEVHR